MKADILQLSTVLKTAISMMPFRTTTDQRAQVHFYLENCGAGRAERWQSQDKTEILSSDAVRWKACTYLSEHTVAYTGTVEKRE